MMNLNLRDIDVFGNHPVYKSCHRFEYSTIGTTDALLMFSGASHVITHEEYNFLKTNTTLKISSSSAADAGVVYYKGMKINAAGLWEETKGSVTLAGQTQVDLPEQLIRLSCCKYLTASGSPVAVKNAGDIYVYTGTATAGVPDNRKLVQIAIPANYVASQGVITPIPENVEYGVVHGIYINHTAKDLELKLIVRDNNYTNPTFQVHGPITTKEGDFVYIDVHFPISGKTDVMLVGKSSATTKTFFTGYDIYYRMKV